ncbi:unnamed protein product [Malus baccata var. baccata]
MEIDYVLSAALANAGDDGGGEVLRLDLGVHGLEIPSFYPLECQLELGTERVHSGRVAAEFGKGEGFVVFMLGIEEGVAGVELEGKGGRVEGLGLLGLGF